MNTDDIRNRKGGAIIIDKDDNILLIQQSKNNIWSLPKGSLKNGETEYDAVIRETLEETGLDISIYEPVAFLKTKVYESSVLLLIYKIDKSNDDIPIKLTSDNIQYKWVPFHPYPTDFFNTNTVNKLTKEFFKQKISISKITNSKLNNMKRKKYFLNYKKNNTLKNKSN